MNKVRLHEVKASSDDLDTILRFAESIIEQAKSGRITGMAAAFTYFDGQGGHGWACSKFTNQVALLGEVEILKHRIVAELEYDEDPQD